MMAMHIEVDLQTQCLRLLDGSVSIGEWSVSCARNGPGEVHDSECTPRGVHRVMEKIGSGCAANMVFVGRQASGEIYTPEMRDSAPDRDWILTRILWLAGCEPGRNQGGNVDSASRFIYIHGAPDDVNMCVPGSHGCIRMRNAEVIALFDLVDEGTKVVIS